MNRNAILQTKAEEIRTALTKWAKREQLLGTGEQLLLTIAVKQVDTVVVNLDLAPAVFHPRGDSVLRPLTEDEWRTILAIECEPIDKALFQVFMAHNGRPIDDDEITDGLPEGLKRDPRICWKGGGLEGSFLWRTKIRNRLNGLLSKNNLPFRWRAVGYKSKQSAICHLTKE